jgi:hypothetical protein
MKVSKFLNKSGFLAEEKRFCVKKNTLGCPQPTVSQTILVTNWRIFFQLRGLSFTLVIVFENLIVQEFKKMLKTHFFIFFTNYLLLKLQIICIIFFFKFWTSGILKIAQKHIDL